MTFTSPVFFGLLLCTIGFCSCMRTIRGRNVVLLLAGFVFYGWVEPKFLLLLLASAAIAYGCALAMEKRPWQKNRWLSFSVAINLGILALFKYADFFLDGVASALASLGAVVTVPTLSILLPAGVSFYTFQALGYCIDVWRGTQKAERSFVDFALYLSFFPQLVAGPIERASDLLPQIKTRRSFTEKAVTSGVMLMLLGFVQKTVVADNIALTVNALFSLKNPSFPLLWTGALLFGMQIHADFAGYTSIARGAARLLGFELSQNFAHPYAARSPREFWNRWHITLSKWLRDYLYIPLGGSRRSTARTAINILVVFALCGLWHGAAANFVLWGLLWGCAVAAEHLWRKAKLPTNATAGLVFTFATATVGWLIFRQGDTQALAASFMLAPWIAPASDWKIALYLLLGGLVFNLPMTAHFLYDAFMHRHTNGNERFKHGALALCALLMIMLLTYVRAAGGGSFLYFRF